MGSLPHMQQMDIFFAGLYCHRCDTKITQMEATPPLQPGEETIRFECHTCGQRYEIELTTTSRIYAVTLDEDTVLPVAECENCHRLYPADGQHTCAEELEDRLVRLYVLGQSRLEYRTRRQHWRSIPDASIEQQILPLLHLLISSPGRRVSREQAIQALWADLDVQTATTQLDRAVHSLRYLFDADQPANSGLLLTEHATLLLADQAQVWVNADAFQELLSQAHGNLDLGQTEQLLEEAALLYNGDYLPEERDIPWVQARRESLQRSWIGLLLELADLRIAREAKSAAIDILDRLLAVDPANEAAVQRLIPLLAQSGRRAEARRIYQRFATVLRQEYKIKPLQETRALYEAI